MMVVLVFVFVWCPDPSVGCALGLCHHHRMDPLAGLLHMGSLIYPGAIDKTTKDDSRHPLVSLVEKLLPYEKKQWTVLDRFLNSLGRIGDVAKRVRDVGLRVCVFGCILTRFALFWFWFCITTASPPRRSSVTSTTGQP